MDSTFYKTVTTRRALKYSYYFSAPVDGKPIVLLIHGFPSTSYDWRYQVNAFQAAGYGLIVPDMLGYGGTDKPNDVNQYLLSLMNRDVVDILDFENADKVIGIGHDWGSIFLSRLANNYADRFIAFGFLAVGYVPPSPLKFSDYLANTVKLAGYELLGYWYFFAEDTASKLLEENFESFFSMLLADDSKLWRTHVAPTDALKAWVEADKRTEYASFLLKEEVEKQKENLLIGGLSSPLLWYKVKVTGLDAEDGKDIAPQNFLIHKPAFFGAATRDYVCTPALGKVALERCSKGSLTIKDYDAGHWLLWEQKDKLNEDLLEWIRGLPL